MSHDVVTRHVREDIVAGIMRRIGVSMPARQFVHDVGLAYASVAPTKGAARTELLHSDTLFREAIRHASGGRDVLALGCGDGLCGFDSTYAHNEFVAVWPAAADALDEQALTTPYLWNRAAWPIARYDVVVSYVIAHYLYDLSAFFDLVTGALRPGGAFVLAGHNASFWKVDELRQHAAAAGQQLRRRRGWRQSVAAHPWLTRLRRLMPGNRAPDLMDQVNRLLAERLGARRRMSRAELTHLIDIHRPPEQLPDPLQIGLPGFDIAELTTTYLPGFSLEFYGTRGWAGFIAEDRLTGELSARSAILARTYPNDGAFFSACWRKR